MVSPLLVIKMGNWMLFKNPHKNCVRDTNLNVRTAIKSRSLHLLKLKKWEFQLLEFILMGKDTLTSKQTKRNSHQICYFHSKNLIKLMFYSMRMTKINKH